MISAPPWLLRLGFRGLTSPRARAFSTALRHPRAAQDEVLGRITRLVAGSPYASRHGITAGMSYAQFAGRVPVVEYADLSGWIEREARTGVPQLSTQPALVFEQTSGSSGGRKLIPYTPALLGSFNATFVIWSHDLVARGPHLETGRMFWSVSPALQSGERTPAGVPISLSDDSAYLSPWLQRLLGPAFVTAGSVNRRQSPAGYRLGLAERLLLERRLEVISVWSPTYLLALLDTLAAHRDQLADRIQLAAPDCADILRRDPLSLGSLWPDLKLISCWTDAGSAQFVPTVSRAFPEVVIQGKGLLATEAPITVPLVGAPAPVPLVDEVFLEFEADDGSILRLDQLEPGAQYGLIVSQKGGLLRYRMNDLIRVEERVDQTPCLRFMGRAGRICDLTGEKLDEPLARAALCEVLGGTGHCSFLTPLVPAGQLPRYRCVTDHPDAARSPAAVADRLDSVLRRSFQYRQSRLLGQLGAVTVEHAPVARRRYEEILLDRGLRWGNIKFEALLLPGQEAGAQRP